MQGGIVPDIPEDVLESVPANGVSVLFKKAYFSDTAEAYSRSIRTLYVNIIGLPRGVLELRLWITRG